MVQSHPLQHSRLTCCLMLKMAFSPHDARAQRRQGQMVTEKMPLSPESLSSEHLEGSSFFNSPSLLGLLRKNLWNGPSRHQAESTRSQLEPPGSLKPGILLSTLSRSPQYRPAFLRSPLELLLFCSPLSIGIPRLQSWTSSLLITSQTVCLKLQCALPHLKTPIVFH